MKKHKNTSFVSGVSQRLGIPFDMLSKLPYIKMTSNREIIVEDAGVLVEYNDSCVSVLQRKLKITVCGRGLKIKSLANGSISVCDVIENVGFAGEGEAVC